VLGVRGGRVGVLASSAAHASCSCGDGAVAVVERGTAVAASMSTKAERHAAAGTWGRTPVRFYLLGFRVVRKDAQVLVIRLPWWCRRATMIREAMTRTIADSAIEGVEVDVTHGYRLLRVERRT
jgi:hypothetical protein